jgi:hypothetical protein
MPGAPLNQSVVLANADVIDTVRVVSHLSITVRALAHSRACRVVRLVSEPCCAPVGDSCAPPPNRSSATLREAPEAVECGSTPVGVDLFRLAGLEVWRLHHESFQRRRAGIASDFGYSGPGKFDAASGTTGGTEGNSRIDSNHEPRESALGRFEDPW